MARAHMACASPYTVSTGSIGRSGFAAQSNVSWTHYAQRKIATEEPTIQDAFRRRFWWACVAFLPSLTGNAILCS